MARRIGLGAGSFLALIVLAIVPTVGSPHAAFATPVVNITAGATYQSTIPCGGGTCVTSAYLDDTAWNASNVLGNVNSAPRILDPRIPYPGGNLFLQGFNTWNAMGGGQGWTLVDGTMNGMSDLGGSFGVATFQTAANCNGGVSGQVCINVTTTNVTGLPALGANQAVVRAQALFDNYTLAGKLVPPFFEMDTLTPAAA